MPTFIVRVWMPDRPGALGAVASRIGAVRGDLIGIEILERGGGRAIDELVIDLPAADLLDLLVQEIGEVDGVDVEHVRPQVESLRDARLDALETAALLAEQQSVGELLRVLSDEAYKDFEATWVTVVDFAACASLVGVGEPPPAAWLSAFVAGGRSSVAVAAGDAGPDDVAWTELPVAGLALIVGREGRPFRARERRQLAALARIADSRWSELIFRTSIRQHPSAS